MHHQIGDYVTEIRQLARTLRGRMVLLISQADSLIREFTRVQPAGLVPEVRLHLADALVPLWQATEWQAAAPQPPPFWAFVWPGSAVLGRYVLDNPSLVARKRVLDFGSGSGLAAIAAARAGAANVVACDLDPLAASVQSMNAALNDVDFERYTGDALLLDLGVDVILAGDVCYEREPSERIVDWLRRNARPGRAVLLADPGRHYAPSDGLELLSTYDVPTLYELESATVKRTRLWAVRH
jgi:predicted nicotinamide N-methyase